MKRLNLFGSLLLLFILFIPSVSPAFGRDSDRVTLTILHVNDTHGHILPFIEKGLSEEPMGGSARLASMIQDERRSNPDGTLLLSAGDMFQGTPISNVFRGKPVLELMNLMKFDAMALGNHEFDWGIETLGGILSAANFPVLSANIIHSSGRPLSETRPYILLQRKGVRIAVIGITTPETSYATKPANVAGLRFQDPLSVLPPLIARLKPREADLVIVLSHQGLDADKRLADKVHGIDLIVGGHSHTVMTAPLKVSGTVIVQAGYYGLYLGVLGLEYDRSSRSITTCTSAGELRPVYSSVGMERSASAAEIVEYYDSRTRDEFSRVLGETKVDLTRRSRSESNLGDMIADSIRDSSGAQVGFQNGGGIRADIPAGRITLEQVFSMLPFDNVVVTMDLSGHEIIDILERSAASEIGMLQVSGLNVIFSLNNPPGKKVVSVTHNGQPIDPQHKYRIVTNDFLAAGGDRYEEFTRGENLLYGDNLRDVFVAWISSHSPVDRKIDSRITLQ